MKNSIINTTEIQAMLENARLSCNTAEQYAALNARIVKVNADLFNQAVEIIATGSNIIFDIVSRPVVNQFAPVENNGESVAVKKNPRLIEYSAVANFIKKHNKAIDKGEKTGEKIALPFTNADFVLFNVYGANVSKENLTNLDCRTIDSLAEFVPSVECFKQSSNTKMLEQLNHLFARIGEVAGITDSITAIGKNHKLLAMEFIKYRGTTHTLRINSVDKLIDYVINQFVISKDNLAITVKSSLDIHKKPKEEKAKA